MISARLARRVASIHKWLGLILGAQLVVWTCTGLFFTLFPLAEVRGEALVHPAQHFSVDMRRVKVSSTQALNTVAEDRPQQAILRPLAGNPVYEIRAEIGVFLVNAETGEVIQGVDEDLARKIASNAWAGPGLLQSVEEIKKAPHEAGVTGHVWAAHFAGDGHPTLYVSAVNGQLGAARTDLWRLYDFFYGLHVMDYIDHENAHQPWTIAAAILAISVVLFGITLLVHRFTRGLIREKPEAV
jgi:uncharacterized iron-regulated membrane protein